MDRGDTASASDQINQWREIIQFWYPELQTKTYCVPPVHFNRVPYEVHTVSGQSALVPQLPVCVDVSRAGRKQPQAARHAGTAALPSPPKTMWLPAGPVLPGFVSEHDVRDDVAQQHVLHCLQTLAEERKEVMFILSQLSFGAYLNKPGVARAATLSLPRPADLGRQVFDRGDFDVLILHRHCGVLVGEIKSVGINAADLDMTPKDLDVIVAKRVARTCKQLGKAGTLVRYLVSDLAPDIRVRKTNFLPYVGTDQLRRALDSDAKLLKTFCDTAGVADVDSAVELSVCSDKLSDRSTPYDVSKDTLGKLNQWFERLMYPPDPSMSADIYTELVARFAGPATSVMVHGASHPLVEVRTLWEAASELGERVTRVTLTPRQVELVSASEARVCLCGPPGTGKSLTLALVGLRWLSEGHDVIVVSTTGGSLAVSMLLCRQLEIAHGRELPTVHFLKFDMHLHAEDTRKAIEELVKLPSRCRPLHILMDEAKFAYSKVGLRLKRVVEELLSYDPDLHLWAATLEHSQVPDVLRVERLTLPLRSVPTVVREVRRGLDRYGDVIDRYTEEGMPYVSDGPRVIRLRHDGAEHSGKWPVQCRRCGVEVAEVLRTLCVGFRGPASPPPLQYRDVFVITRSAELGEQAELVAGLRERGVPVRVVACSQGDPAWEDGVQATALARDDAVTVAVHTAVSGLERKVVVFLPGRRRTGDLDTEQVEARDRVIALSRCVAQLVMVDVPMVERDDLSVTSGKVSDVPD